MITPNSRYASSTIVTLDVNSSSRQVIYPRTYGNFSFSGVTYVYKSSDSIDGVAFRFYGDPTQWWKIGQANPQIVDWSAVPPGTSIRIPAA